MIDVRIGDSRQLIYDLVDKSIDCVVTSPPYWGLRDYGNKHIIFDGNTDCDHSWDGETHIFKMSGGTGKTDVGNYSDNRLHFERETNFCSKCGAWRGQLGLEPTPELFIKHLLDFFDDVKMKLKDEGNCFVNLGDTYSGSKVGNTNGVYADKIDGTKAYATTDSLKKSKSNYPSKCLCFIPERFAIGMVERGWICRNSIIWAKPNHMPESVTDRLTKAHEVVYHFVKQGRYYYNLDAIREPHKGNNTKGCARKIVSTAKFGRTSAFNGDGLHEYHPLGANPGDVWSIPTQPYPESHFAVFPLDLVRRPILAGCPIGGTVLDPFGGSGTVGEFCRHNDRNAILFELNPEYKRLIEDRTMLNIPELGVWVK